MPPKFAIVTIARNEARTIADSLHSFRGQSYVNFECVVVDGKSADDTEKIARGIAEQDHRFRVINQTSKGISAAFNEGIAATTAPYLVFVNAGDALNNPKALELANREVDLTPGAIHCFRGRYADEHGQPIDQIFPSHDPSTADLEFSCVVAHQATIVPRNVFTLLGGYSSRFKIAMDYEVWLRAWVAGIEFRWHKDVIALHRMGGISFTQLSRSRTEVVAARLLNLPVRRKSMLKDFAQILLAIWGERRRENHV